MDAIGGGYNTRGTTGAGGAKSGGGVTLQDLKKQYPDLKLSAQSFASMGAVEAYASKQSGKYNVAIHPKALEKMGNDPELAANLHEFLGRVKTDHDQSEQFAKALGATDVSVGTVIDENGKVSMWMSGTTGSKSDSPGLFATTKKNSPEDLAKKLDEKRQERLAEEKRLEKKRLEKAVEVDASVTIDASASVDADTARTSVDFTA